MDERKLGVMPPYRVGIDVGSPQIEGIVLDGNAVECTRKLLSRTDLVFLNEVQARIWALRRGQTLPEDLLAHDAPRLPALCLRKEQALLVTPGARGALLHHASQPLG